MSLVQVARVIHWHPLKVPMCLARARVFVLQEGAFRTKQSVQMIDFEACLPPKALVAVRRRGTDKPREFLFFTVLSQSVGVWNQLESAQQMLVDARSAARSGAVRSVAPGHTSCGVLPRHPWAYGDSVSVLLQRRSILLVASVAEEATITLETQHHRDSRHDTSWITHSTLSSCLMTTWCKVSFV